MRSLCIMTFSLSMHLAFTRRCLLFFQLHSNYSVYKGHSDILCRKRLRKTHPNYSPFTACQSPLKTENESKRKKKTPSPNATCYSSPAPLKAARQYRSLLICRTLRSVPFSYKIALGGGWRSDLWKTGVRRWRPVVWFSDGRLVKTIKENGELS